MAHGDVSRWINKEAASLDLTGRDEFYTSLITQEAPFFLDTVVCGGLVPSSEVSFLCNRRGFNPKERAALNRLAAFFNDNAEKIRELSK